MYIQISPIKCEVLQDNALKPLANDAGATPQLPARKNVLPVKSLKFAIENKYSTQQKTPSRLSTPSAPSLATSLGAFVYI